MIVPEKFKFENVVDQETPFECKEEAASGTHAKKGNLQIGRLVWTEERIGSLTVPGTVSGFVDNIGIVSLDSRHLRPLK